MTGFRLPATTGLLLILALTVQPASGQTANPPGSDSQANSPATMAAPPTPDPAMASYVIGPGDTLQVFVWQNPELSLTVPVRPDGRISTPLVEDMVAVGKTPPKLAADLQTALSDYVRNPQVSVIVSNPVGALGQVKVIGQVKTPIGIPYREGLRVLDVILQAGGVTDYAAPNRAKLMRTENGRQKEIRLRLADLLDDGDLQQNLVLQPGDVIVVPEAIF